MMRRWPFADLARSMGMEPSAAARRLGLSGTTWKQVRDLGLKHQSAEQRATKAGFHPAEVWGQAWLDAEWDELSIGCVARGCQERFIPTRKGHKYCSDNCRNREGNRRFYNNNELWRARKRKQNRAYQAEASRAILARKQAYYRENAEQIKAKRRAHYQANREQVIARNTEYKRRKRQQREEAA